MKILYFTNQEDFEKCSINDIMAAHLVVYKEHNDLYHIAKATYHLSNQSVSEDIFHRFINETIQDYQNNYDIPKYKCGDVLRWQRYEKDEYHYSIIQMKHSGCYYFDSPMPQHREANVALHKVQTLHIDNNCLIKKATEKERQIFFKNYIPKYESGDILAYGYGDSTSYFKIRSVTDGVCVYIFEQPSTLISAFSFRIDNNPKFRKARIEETLGLSKFNQPIQVTETGKIEPIETTDDFMIKKEIEIWEASFNICFTQNHKMSLDSIFSFCDRAVQEFRKSFKGRKENEN